MKKFKAKIKLSDLHRILPELPTGMKWEIGSNGRKNYLMIVRNGTKVMSKVTINYPFPSVVSGYLAVGEALLRFDKNRGRKNYDDYVRDFIDY